MVHADDSALTAPSTPDAAIPTHSAPARRSLVVAGLCVVGILVAQWLEIDGSMWWLAASAVLGATGLATRGWGRRISLSLGVIALAGGWFTMRALERPASDIAWDLTEAPSLITVQGTLIEHPRERSGRSGRLGEFLPAFDASTMFRLSVESIGGGEGGEEAAAGGELLVFAGARERELGLSAGMRVRATGMARAVRPTTNPGEPDRLLWARATGQSGTMRVDSAEMIRRVSGDDSATASAWRWWYAFRAGVRARASAWLGGDDATGDGRALMQALFLGQREDSLRDVSDAFTRLGLAHVLAISGLHLALLAWALRQVVRFPGARPWLESLIVVAIIAAYLLVIPVRAPVMRAAITAIGFLLADAGGRRYDRLSTLGWVFVATLMWQPMELFSVGFQLSFGVVAALLTLARPLRDKLFGPRPSADSIGTARGFVEGIKDSAAASVCAWLAASPLIMLHMGLFAPLGAIATILFMPFVAALLCAGYVVMLGSVFVPAAGEIAAPLLERLGELVARFAILVDRAPGAAVSVPPVSLVWMLAATATMVWWMAPLPFDVRPWVLRARWAASTAAAVWLGASAVFLGLPRDVALRLDTIDVADGSCHLIRSGHEAMLYDCGSLRLAMGEREIPSALRALGVWRVPTVVLSHPNIDHYSALVDLVRPIGVCRVLMGESMAAAAERAPNGPVAATLRELAALGVETRIIGRGEKLTLGDATIEVISPALGATWKFENDSSLALLIRAPVASADVGRDSVSLLMCGDIQRTAMATILADWPGLTVDVLEAPHHGSAHSAAFEFVTDLKPSIVVQSTGESRLNDARWDKVRDGRAWWSTASHGAVRIFVLRDGAITASGWREKPRVR